MNKVLENISKIESIIDKRQFVQQLLWQICKQTDACQGAFYIKENTTLKFIEGYAFPIVESDNESIEIGEGITGQVAKDGKYININDVPEGYLTIISGLGKSNPTSLLIFPFKKNNECIAIIEIAGFKNFDDEVIEVLNNLNELVCKKI